MNVRIGPIGQIVHLAGETGSQPGMKAIDSRRRNRRANSAQIEPGIAGFRFQSGGNRAGLFIVHRD